ncbi:MAG TPA: hypothetical protein VNA17_00665 [Pyrinomonadaceae bacterium]|nr:hypothetical protein [Pyrinomonadaceae bacterium]
MTPERWHEIEEIFHEASDLDGDARAKYLNERVDGDNELRSEVEKLLSQFDEASSFIERPLYESGKNALLSSLLDDTDEDAMIGVVLGNLGPRTLALDIGRVLRDVAAYRLLCLYFHIRKRGPRHSQNYRCKNKIAFFMIFPPYRMNLARRDCLRNGRRKRMRKSIN